MISELVLLGSLAHQLDFGAAIAVPRETCGIAWAQCGGAEFTGSKCCESGYSCVLMSDYYSQCQPNKAPTGTESGVGAAPTFSGPLIYTTSLPTAVTTRVHTQAAYPSPSNGACGSWSLTDNVCCPTYCANDNRSESCSTSSSCTCTSPPSAMCKSGAMYPEVHSVTKSEPWHFSRSTHFGLTSGGACGFGLYGLCTKGSTTASWTDSWLGSTCTAFCTAYPALCKDPAGMTLRGNFAAPNGDYYTQFWPSLPGDLDNYLSCGECMQVIRTKPDGTDYVSGETGYTDPIVLEVVDSCPCNANSKWCCGPGADHCGEIDFKYGCPLPSDSIHLDLSDIAMGRLQGNGSMTDGVIPTRYKRVPCPKPGNVYIWLRDGGGPYYFALTVVNTAGVGSVTNVEIQVYGTSGWTSMVHDPNYSQSRPQERYGSWVMPKGAGPFALPIAVRITSPTGEQLVAMKGISSFTPPAGAPAGFYYIDLGVQFSA
ncbi:expansin module family protein [Halenospora varia]|nr:expansin module family protein [Halenospora varia]